MIAYAGLQAARKSRDFYAKLLAAGITSVILSQAVVNFFAVLGLLPLTGVPLPFISPNSSLVVLLAAMGLLCNVAQGETCQSRQPADAGSGACWEGDTCDWSMKTAIVGRSGPSEALPAPAARGRRNRWPL